MHFLRSHNYVYTLKPTDRYTVHSDLVPLELSHTIAGRDSIIQYDMDMTDGGNVKLVWFSGNPMFLI